MSIKNKLLTTTVLVGGAALYLRQQNTSLQTSYYTLAVTNLEKENEGLKIAHLSDLHLPRTQVNLEKVLKKIADEAVDFIFLTGDQFDAGQSFNRKQALDFFCSLRKIAAVYAIHGNHDQQSPRAEEIPDLYQEAGITLLEDNAYSVMAENRRPIVIMGAAEPASLLKKQKRNLLSKVMVRPDWQGQTRLLLAHRPELFERYHQDKTKAPDITFSGHAHGGQVRIPKVGGLFAPGQGRLPKHTSGVHALAADPSKRLVISRGLGPSQFPFRVNNRPELIFVSLTEA